MSPLVPFVKPSPAKMEHQARVQQELSASMDQIRYAIASASSIREAYAIYESLQPIAKEMTELVDLAMDRCDRILEAM